MLRQEFENAFATKKELSTLKSNEVYSNGKFTDLLSAINKYGKTYPGTAEYASAKYYVESLIQDYKIAKSKKGV